MPLKIFEPAYKVFVYLKFLVNAETKRLTILTKIVQISYILSVLHFRQNFLTLQGHQCQFVSGV